MLLTAAIEMTKQESALLLEMAKLSAESRMAWFYPQVVTARWHHRQVTLLLQKGRLSDDLEEIYGEYIIKNHPDAADLISARLEQKQKSRPPAA